MSQDSKKRDKFSPLTIIMLVILLFYCVALLAMLYWGLSQSFKSARIYTYDKIALPKKGTLSLANYVGVFKVMKTDWIGDKSIDGSFSALMINTLFYAVGAAFVNVAVTCLVAYLTARYTYFYSKILYTIVVVVMVVPVVGAQASEVQMLRMIKLYDTRWGFLALKASFVGGVYFLVFHAAFEEIPDTYSEAAMMDGAGHWCIMLKICLPLVLNVFMTVFLITFIQYWNDYNLPLIYMPHYPTLSRYIFYLSSTSSPIKAMGESLNSNSKTVQLAGTFVLMLPVFTIFIFLHKRLMGNLSVGGIKG